MKQLPAVHQKNKQGLTSKRKATSYYSVEFSFEGVECIYQFKVWHTPAVYKCIIVKEDSNFLKWIRLGDTHTLKCNFENATHLSVFKNTVIRFSRKQEKGRYKGHYIVGLEMK
ncbi:MAG: hypothetical protein JRJ85_24400 [Deltaproteobacteria bacterium]|nr:hypothetical protein [Deltaproteobacteria bacterium]